MPNLRTGEYMHTCESDICSLTTGGSRTGKPRPYIVRTYFIGIERKWCSTCCRLHKLDGITEDRFDARGQWDGYKLVRDE